MRPNISFGKNNRSSFLHEMVKEELDLLVVGGGITGCGIALDAALRGLKVGLIEMQDFGSGTSSRSTKLIHGGLRYLKHGEFNLVREVGRERSILYHNAPHLVHPEPMLLPLYKQGTYGKLSTSIGLWLYDRFAGVSKVEQRKMLNKDETLLHEPLLKSEGLKGSGLYVEYKTDDARLTIEVIKTAVAKGALAVNYTQAKEFFYSNGQVIGLIAEDRLNKQEYHLKAKLIVNATGPWVDRLREQDKSKGGKLLHLTKGVHIVIPKERLPLGQAIYFDVADGRMIFAIPRDSNIYIGTTDTDYSGELDNPSIDEGDIAYLLAATNAIFPTVSLAENDIISCWAGVRPLIHKEGKMPSELSRKDEILYSPSGLISIAGGKLSGFRKMAEKIVDKVVLRLEEQSSKRFLSCLTINQVLSGGEVNGIKNWEKFLQENTERLLKHHLFAGNRSLQTIQVSRLVRRYGSNIDRVLHYLSALPAQAELRIDGQIKQVSPFLLAELLYSREEEMAVCAEDFLWRRTDLALFNRTDYHKYYSVIDTFFKSPL